MFRIVMTLVVGSILGIVFGRLQATVATRGFEERFTGSRATLAEQRGEKTRVDVVKQSTGMPEVEVIGGTEFEFGTMQHGGTMTHDFVFKNVGDGPLNLDMGGSTCKCTVGELESSVLQPGEETKVTLTWTAQSITTDYGQTATILTNAPASPEIRLKVTGQIANSFVIEPASLTLGDVSVTDGVSRTFHIFCYLEESKELSEFSWTDSKTSKLVKITSSEVDLDAEKFPNHKNAYRVFEGKLDIEPGLQIGPINSRITFFTDLQDKIGTLEIPVTGRVTGDIVLVGGPSFDSEKNILTIGNVQSSEGAQVGISLAVQGEGKEDIQPAVLSVVPEESLKVRIGEPKVVANRRYFPIILEVPKGAPEVYLAGNNPKNFGKVVLKTNHKYIPEIQISVRISVIK